MFHTYSFGDNINAAAAKPAPAMAVIAVAPECPWDVVAHGYNLPSQFKQFIKIRMQKITFITCTKSAGDINSEHEQRST